MMVIYLNPLFLFYCIFYCLFLYYFLYLYLLFIFYCLFFNCLFKVNKKKNSIQLDYENVDKIIYLFVHPLNHPLIYSFICINKINIYVNI